MFNKWAEVSLDRLPTEVRIEGNESEYLIRWKANIERYCPFTVFNFLISKWVWKGGQLNYTVVFKLYHDCLEKLKRQPQSYTTKRELILTVSKYDIEALLSDPLQLRKILKEYDNVFGNVLYSPRSLGSEGLKRYEGFTFTVLTLPGKKKRDFPNVQYIGVGYRDKGHCRIVEHDASPSWQEVAADRRERTSSTNEAVRIKGQLQLIHQESWTKMREKSAKRRRNFRRKSESPLFS